MVLYLILHLLILLIFGILVYYALVCLMIQVITGVALAMHYAAEVSYSFFQC